MKITFDILTIFPEMFYCYFNSSMLARAQKNNLIKINVRNLRDYTKDKHKVTDDAAYGGISGMVMKVEPIYRAVRGIKLLKSKTRIILLSAKGKILTQAHVRTLAKYDQIILIAGHYKGVDERVVEHLATAEISIGDYIISGGELAAAVVVDAVTRYVPGVVGKQESILKDSFSDPAVETQLVEHPHYTRPAEFRGWKVPEVLISGDHEAVRKWRYEAALKKTERNRPDLLRPGNLER